MTGEVEAGRIRSMHPQKFAMWLFLGTVSMLFIAFSSGFIVQKAAKDLLLLELPQVLRWSTLVIILSSVSMHFAYLSAKRNNIREIKIGLVFTALLSFVFVLMQMLAWNQLVEMGMHFVSSNPLESFVYVFTGLHVIHLVGAIVFLLIVLGQTFKYQVHSKSMLRIEMCTTFWHFLGGLWLYLYLFLIFNN